MGVKKVGCSGFAYTYDYADEVRADDRLFEAHGTKVVVDAKSLDFLKARRSISSRKGLKQAFKFENPNVDATCGCGESFSVKGERHEQRSRATRQQALRARLRTDIESETAPKGLSEDTIRLISAKKNEPEWLLEFRLKAYRHWLTMAEPHVAERDTTRRSTSRTSSTTRRPSRKKLKSMDEVDPELLRTFEKLGVPMNERAKLAGVAVDVIFDSVSVATTYKEKLAKVGIIFCSISEAVRDHPELVRKYHRQRRAAGGQLSTRRSTRRCSPTARSASSRRA